MTDLAADLRALYLRHCADCEAAGIKPPTPEEWVDVVDDTIRERMSLKWREHYKRDRH